MIITVIVIRDNGDRPSVPRSSHVVCLGMSKFVKRHLSPQSVAAVFCISVIRLSPSDKILCYFTQLKLFNLFSYRCLRDRPNGDRTCSRSDIDMTIYLYILIIHILYTDTPLSTYTHFPSPPPTFNDSINDRIHGWSSEALVGSLLSQRFGPQTTIVVIHRRLPFYFRQSPRVVRTCVIIIIIILYTQYTNPDRFQIQNANASIMYKLCDRSSCVYLIARMEIITYSLTPKKY